MFAHSACNAVVMIAVPVVALGHVYPIYPKGVLWGSNTAIQMAKEAPECCCSVDRRLIAECAWPSVVMLERLAFILLNGNNMVLQNFITVLLSHQCTVE
jgi:hypothetical protein